MGGEVMTLFGDKGEEIYRAFFGKVSKRNLLEG